MIDIKIFFGILSVFVSVGSLFWFFKCKKLLYQAYPNLWERNANPQKAIFVSLVFFMPVISIVYAGLAILLFFFL